MQASAQGTAEPDLEVPLLFNIQDESLSVFLGDNVKAANHAVNTSSADFAVRALLPDHLCPLGDPNCREGRECKLWSGPLKSHCITPTTFGLKGSFSNQ